MTPRYTAWTEQVLALDEALTRLEPRAAELGLRSPQGSEWHDLLRQKLVPQLRLPPVLVVAVVGGTNIGKSVVFNHLAGENASGVSPLAAGTRHPVCIVPQGLCDPAVLARLFEPFALREWHSPHDSLEEAAEHRLFWRAGKQLPERLLVLDAPDIDSDAVVNWQRADCLRQVSDLLVAVLTQQKYNDAAVKQFFRQAVRAEKPLVIVFNQCDLVQDREYWPTWLATFCDETGARPEAVLVCPYDRAAAAELRLPFFPVGCDGRQPPGAPANLRELLAYLPLEAIKLRTLRGALGSVVDPEQGAPEYLRRVRQGAAEFQTAAQALSATELARVHWPNLPPRLLVHEIAEWWDARRSDWSRRVHGFYRRVGSGISWPLRKAWQSWGTPTSEEDLAFSHSEREAVIAAVGQLLDELDRLARLGNETLRPRLLRLLGGASRQALLEKVCTAHAQLEPIDEHYRRYLRTELDRWSDANPRVVTWLRSLDHVLALARPAITISLAIGGGVLAGGLVHEAVAQAAGHTAGQLATEAAITGGITVGGEGLVGATGEGMRRAAAQLFRQLQQRYAEERAGWLARWLERELLGDLLEELRAGAELPTSEPFRQAESALAGLATHYKQPAGG